MSWMEEVVHESENYKLVVRWRKIANVVSEEIKLIAEAELVAATGYTEDVLAERYHEEKTEFLGKNFDSAVEEVNEKLEEFIRDLKDWGLIAAARFLRLKNHDFEIRF